MLYRITLRIHGIVQGVFFRDSTRDYARGLGLVGFVKNCSDGTVEAVAEGPKDALENLRDWCKKGPELAAVVRVEEQWKNIDEKSVDTFEVVLS
ncbi:MAG TPA: acylphosphatase [Candidatus Magasanikbacteria bacterium]|nr:MAG: hypothetical protein A3I74_00135 [Candidatus Magasanikbacteria bacterium RIFCSPLOWO2_02_FULL_47_16]OGH80135.1 MAG: hypothetical protein A3C10_03095 [Candidatus Magasanikbacteria bacterium RIFCSPHIGHO2_02_FULL_48_18]OGH82647.1 MAG: hypothetical protein A3G08_02815 [Candidatus Magasanikbacteria bacterium RIFCSPLOWO2_12_FULL_47_9b]HAZ28966.1 acylphosphatase [Candidatus Magasanikbacteria bacterium]